MKKYKILIYAVIAVTAGILTGILISAMLWKDNMPDFITDFFTDEENPDTQAGDEPEDEDKTAYEADYNITNSQRYYTSIADKKDVNVLLIGEDAYSGNFDTLIIASLSEKNKKIQLVNIPRDIYIDYSDDVLALLKEKSPKLYNAKGFQKINAAHTVGARIGYEENNGKFGDSNIDFLADLIEEIFQIPISDFAYVNTKGFRDIVDLFGGVDINVPVRMKYDDPLQNLHIDLQPGMQHLNGIQAEGFVRFRQGYDDNGEFKNYSDQFRKENQNEFLKAFFNQHINIKNIGKVNELTGLVSDNIRTSIDSVKEVASYVNLTRKAISGKYTLESMIVECLDARSINGVYFDIIRSE